MKLEKTKWAGIYRRAGKYVAVVGYKDGAGEHRQKWLTAPTLTAAKDARREFLNQLDKGLQPSDGRMTLASYLDEWLEEFTTAKGLRPRPLTRDAYRSILSKHVLPLLGGQRLNELHRRTLQTFYRSLTPLTAYRCHRTLSSAFSWAVKERGILGANTCASLRVPRPPKDEARWLEEDEARRMLGVAAGDPIEGAIILGLAGGLRVAELCAARWGDLDFREGMLTVSRSFWGKTKSGKARRFTLPSSQLEALRRVKVEQAQRLLALGIRQGEETHIVTTVLGGGMAPYTLNERFRAFVATHGFDATRTRSGTPARPFSSRRAST